MTVHVLSFLCVRGGRIYKLKREQHKAFYFCLWVIIVYYVVWMGGVYCYFKEVSTEHNEVRLCWNYFCFVMSVEYLWCQGSHWIF